MSRKRHQLEDTRDVAVGEPGLEQPLRRGAADEPLSARARVDPGRLDADHAPDARGRRGGDPDQLHHRLRRQVGHGRAAGDGVLRLDPHFGTQCTLSLDDVAGDVLGERLDVERLCDHDGVDRLAEDLREAGHVDALLGRVEIDGAGDVGGEGLLAARRGGCGSPSRRS